MRLIKRLLRRLLIFGLGVFTVWFVVFVVFEDADHRLPWILAVGPYLRNCRVYCSAARHSRGTEDFPPQTGAKFTTTGDGLPGDPVNVALVGTLQQLRAAFGALGWSEADRLGSPVHGA